MRNSLLQTTQERGETGPTAEGDDAQARGIGDFRGSSTHKSGVQAQV
jgi:hypothetical protein